VSGVERAGKDRCLLQIAGGRRPARGQLRHEGPAPATDRQTTRPDQPAPGLAGTTCFLVESACRVGRAIDEAGAHGTRGEWAALLGGVVVSEAGR
jgi:hypothetical protein